MRWIVGIDLRERSSGALHMAAWMRARTRRSDGDAAGFVALHVIDDSVRRAVQGELTAAAQTAMARIADHSGVPNPFEGLEVVQAASAEDGIAQAVSSGFDGALVGRVAPVKGRLVRRLGRVARRLLRRLPAPIMVVPPYLEIADIGRGPIVLATDLGPSSEAGAVFARRLAAELRREIIVAHVDRGVDVVPDLFGEAATITPTRRKTHADIERWASQQELGPVRVRLAEGAAVEGLLAEAEREDTPLVVCGSRRLSATDRIFTSSIGADLARWSDRAVLVVPPP